jgi:hypothetical protein
MNVPAQHPHTKPAAETAVSIFAKNESRLQDVEFHITGAKVLIAEIKQRLRDYELPRR